MEQYLEKGKEVLKVLLNNGCEAYLIGSCVCNTILEIPFNEVEITTNATPEMVKGMFSFAKTEDISEGIVRLTYSGYEFIIETFRLQEVHKDKREPIRIHYSKNLLDELACRDFTINALAMSHGGKLTDVYGGFEDIKKHKIRMIGNPKVRFTEDPIRMFQAIRFVSELRFRLDRRIVGAISRKRKLLKKVPVEAMVGEVKRIIAGKYFKKALGYIMDTKLYKQIPILSREFKRLADRYRAESIDTFAACAFVKNGGYSEEWEDLFDNKARIRKVVELALADPKCNYDSQILFHNGLEVCLDANYVNVLTRRSRKKARRIRRAFSALPIHDLSELKFSEKDILQLTGNQFQEYAQTIVDTMVNKILAHELVNDSDQLKHFALTSLRGYGILPIVEDTAEQPKANTTTDTFKIPESQPEPMKTPETNIAPTLSYSADPALKIDEIERRVSEYERSLREKDQRIKELERQALRYKLDNDLNNLVGQNLEMLKDMNYLEKGTEKILLSRELKQMYEKVLTNVDPKYRTLNDDANTKEGNENHEKQN